VTKDEIPSLIDELPILMVAACFARGRSVFQAVEELRVKETDRIASMVKNLAKMGAKIRVAGLCRREDMVIQGVPYLKGAKVKSFQDHRTAMSMIVAGLCATGKTSIDDTTCISKSFPGFLKTLASLTSK
jgi:3-phosphoshikimate 1-carboxyvinyltransferase